MTTAERFTRFAETEAREHSAIYTRLAHAVAAHRELLDLIDELPIEKRQPNLLLAAARLHGAPLDDPDAFTDQVHRDWADISAVMLRRRTQTNEARRCATLLPVLAGLPQPLALIEVGAAAGLCLYPDQYRYRYDDRPPIGPAHTPVTWPCATSGPVPLPAAPPEVAWRAGIDLNPLDVRDPQDMAWLELLIWPEQTERLQRLRDAVRIARAAPPHLVRGDLNTTIRDLVAQAPDGATPVVFHSAVLAYLPAAEREAFAATMRELPAHWVSNEGTRVLPWITERLPGPPKGASARFVLALDERPVALTGPHGQSLDWFG